MKLDRNDTDNFGRGKYALLKLRRLEETRGNGPFGDIDPGIRAALELLEKEGLLDWGEPETESEFFVIRLKDKYAGMALSAYAAAAEADDREYAGEIRELANRAGSKSPWCKRPD